MPHYEGFVRPTKTFAEVSQWQGKEMRNFGKILVPAMAAAVRDPPPEEGNLRQSASVRQSLGRLLYDGAISLA